MNWRNITTVYGKELRDMLRDRRTIISMIVIPTLVMPALLAIVSVVSLRVMRNVTTSTPSIAISGGDDSPAARAALSGNKRITVVPLPPDWREQIADKRLRAVVELPAGCDAAIQRGEPVAITIYHYAGEMRSERAVSETRQAFNAYADRIVTARLADRGLTLASIRPVQVKAQNIAPPAKVGGNIVGGLIPYFFLLLAFSGAMYPAMDLTAGEKERGTMETLLCSPVARVDLVLGKFLTIVTASLGTIVFSLVSMALTFSVGASLLGRKLAAGGAAGQRAAENLTNSLTLDPLGMVAVVGMILPMIVLFAATLFTISLFAKSFKEAQSYVTPLIFAIILPAVIGTLPGVELNAKLALVPVLNVALASKELVSGVWHWDYLAVIFGSTCAYAAIALALAVRMFQREDVLFRA